MKKFFLPIAVLMIMCISSQFSQAQLKRFSIGPFIEVGFPAGSFSDTHQTGYGIGLGADIKLVAGFTAVGSVSYFQFVSKSGSGVADAKAIPIRVGLRYQLISILYAKLEGGTAQFTGDYNNGVGALVAPGVGIRLLGLDVEAKYEAWFKNSTHGFFGLKAGYHF